jgi:hypothetical protein
MTSDLFLIGTVLSGNGEERQARNPFTIQGWQF